MICAVIFAQDDPFGEVIPFRITDPPKDAPLFSPSAG